MGRSPCCEKVGLKKGPWTPEEDQKLLAFIEEHGHGSWRSLPAKAGLQRCGKSCRLRWTNYLRPDIKRGKFNLQEEQTIIQLHALLGNRWSAIATHLPKRTDNEIKNYWNTHLKKRLTKMGIDPVTHKPKNDALLSNYGPSKNSANLSHMAQWESARLEAEARLVRESKLKSNPFQNQLIISSSCSPPVTLAALNSNKPQNIMRASPSSVVGIDLESPTSTLTAATFSGNVLSQPPMKTATTDQSYDNEAGMMIKEEEEAWNKLGFFADVSTMSTIEEPAAYNNNNTGHEGFVEGFTKLLLRSNNDSTEFNSSDVGSSSGGDQQDGSSCGGGGGGEPEENKNYWTAIFDMVYSASPSNSPVF